MDNEQDRELQRSIEYCDKIIAEGDELSRDFFSMVKSSLLSGESKFEEYMIWDGSSEQIKKSVR